MSRKRLRLPVRAALLLVAAAALQAGAAQANGEATPKERYRALFERMFEEPRDLDVMFAFARQAAQIGKFEAAIATLERMLLINPNLPRVRLELGALYFRLEAFATARDYFQQVKAAEGVPEQVRRRVDQYLARIKSRQTRHSFTGQVFAGLRYQSNANSGPDSNDVRANGVDAILADQFLEEDDVNVFASVYLRHNYDLKTGLEESWESTLLGYTARQQEQTQLDLDVLEATTGPLLALLPRRLDDTSVRPYAKVTHVRLGRDELFTGFGGGIEVDSLIGARTAVSAQYEVLQKDFDNSSGQPTAAQRTGPEHFATVGARHALMRPLALVANLGGTVKNADKDFNSFVEGFVRIGADYQYMPPGGFTRFPWTVSVFGRYAHSDYDDPDPAVDPDKGREDDNWRVTLTNTARIAPSLALQVQAQYANNESNLPNFEYDNWSLIGGVTWRF